MTKNNIDPSHPSQDVRNTLLHYRVRQAVHSVPELRGDVIASVEEALGCRLPADVLAIFAATGQDLRQVARLTKEARRHKSFPATYVALATDTEDEQICYWCICGSSGGDSRRSRSSEPSEVRCWPRALELSDDDLEAYSLAEFLRLHHRLGRPDPTERLAIERRRGDFFTLLEKNYQDFKRSG